MFSKIVLLTTFLLIVPIFSSPVNSTAEEYAENLEIISLSNNTALNSAEENPTESFIDIGSIVWNLILYIAKGLLQPALTSIQLTINNIFDNLIASLENQTTDGLGGNILEVLWQTLSVIIADALADILKETQKTVNEILNGI